MLNEVEAQKLVKKLIEAKKQANISGTKEDKKIFSIIERECLKKFQYMIEMRTNKYKNYSNYDDLNQEGLVALTKALDSYNPELGSLFGWIHNYIKTRISRSANLHTAIKYPLKYARENSPKRESYLPIGIERNKTPDKLYEMAEFKKEVEEHLNILPEKQREVVIHYFGLKDNDYLTINKICKALGMSRVNCVKNLHKGIGTLKNYIEI